MQNSPEFNAFFVSVVKKHEVLYNHSLIGRSDKDRVREAWQKVAAEVQGTEHECKDRWRCLRVCFLRMLRYSQPNHRGVRQNHRKAYYLADAMNFLLPYVKPKHAPLGFEPLDGPVKTEPDFGVEDGLDSEDQSEDQSELYPTDLLELEDGEHSTSSVASSRVPEFYAEPSPASSHETPGICAGEPASLEAHRTPVKEEIPPAALEGRRRKRKANAPVRVQEYYAEKNSPGFSQEYFAPPTTAEMEDKKRLKVKHWSELAAGRQSPVDDGDWLFLKSLLPDMRRLTEKQKRRFKQRVLGLFDDIEEDGSGPSESSHIQF